jgi:hypothetical protein
MSLPELPRVWRVREQIYKPLRQIRGTRFRRRSEVCHIDSAAKLFRWTEYTPGWQLVTIQSFVEPDAATMYLLYAKSSLFDAECE